MIKASFPISTNEGDMTVTGFKTDGASLIGIHREDAKCSWTVTFLPTGTKICSLFPERFGTQQGLLRRITYLEAIELPAWLSLTDLPWGSFSFRPEDAPAIARLKAAATA